MFISRKAKRHLSYAALLVGATAVSQGQFVSSVSADALSQLKADVAKAYLVSPGSYAIQSGTVVDDTWFGNAYLAGLPSNVYMDYQIGHDRSPVLELDPIGVNPYSGLDQYVVSAVPQKTYITYTLAGVATATYNGQTVSMKVSMSVTQNVSITDQNGYAPDKPGNGGSHIGTETDPNKNKLPHLQANRVDIHVGQPLPKTLATILNLPKGAKATMTSDAKQVLKLDNNGNYHVGPGVYVITHKASYVENGSKVVMRELSQVVRIRPKEDLHISGNTEIKPNKPTTVTDSAFVGHYSKAPVITGSQTIDLVLGSMGKNPHPTVTEYQFAGLIGKARVNTTYNLGSMGKAK